MRSALLPLRMAAASLLVVAAGCSSTEPEIHTVLVVDALVTDAAAAPIDLEQSATALGCATEPIFPAGAITLTVDDVVSPREFVITGRYGKERVRPWLEPGTVIRLERFGAREAAIAESLKRQLAGRRLLEPATSSVPAVTAGGLRIVGMATTDLQPLDAMVSSTLDRFAGAESTEPPSGLAVVPRDSASLQERARAAVAQAERWSDFRAPADLVVEWGDADDMGDALESALDDPDACVDLDGKILDEDGNEIEFDTDVEFDELSCPWGISLPGGRIFLNEDRIWLESDIHWVLLHELMHQHQFALCAEGLELEKVPRSLWQAHATSLALEILRQEGLGEDVLAYARENDPENGATRAFDELRAELGLGADECLRRIATDPDLAWRLRVLLEGPILWNPVKWTRAEPWPFANDVPSAGVSFECSPVEGLVTIVNESDAPFSGSTDGWWYSTSTASDELKYQEGDSPFALRLPARGRVTLKTKALPADADPASCFTIFRRTPAPVLEP